MIDLVLSHTSDQHEWFRESRTSRDNPKSDWYVWADPKPDGNPPNNWLSIFGGPAWQWEGERMQYYLHNFLTSQPDLNFHNVDVQDALLDVARFWLDRGVDGFRLDTINFYVHDQQLRDNPPLDDAARNSSIAPAVNPYNHQDHLYDKNQPENLAFLERFRALMDEYPDIAAVGEVGDAQRGLEIVAQYTAGDDRMHMCYSFDFLSGGDLTGRRVADVLGNFEQAAPDGWSCWAFSNHDVVRHASRWGLGEQGLKVYTALMMCLRGSVCIYQGEELGLTEAYVSYDELQDPYGKEFWPKFKGRDGCRTPMPWSSDGPNGGFSEEKPWLPVAMEHLAQSVSSQENAPESMLNFYRDMIGFRKTHPVFAKGDLEVVVSTDEVVAFIRRAEENAPVFCAFNLSNAAQQVQLPDGSWNPVDGLGFETDTGGSGVTLPPYQAYIAEG